MKSALYVRVSTHYQIDKDSLPFQRNELINYSKYLLGIDSYEIFEDAGYSGKNTDRPAFQDMMARIKNGEFTHLLVWKIDRISRNLRDFSEMYDELKEYNITFISKNEQFDTSSAMGEAMLKIILVFAELERKLTAERVYGIMLSRAEKGLWNGANCPLGYVWDDENKFPTIDDEQAKVIRYIFDTYEETLSAFQVMKMLNENGLKTKRGGVWGSKTVVDIIRNPFYKGTYRYNYRESARGKVKDEKEWVVLDNNHPPIIEPDQWERCNAIMDGNAARNTSMFRGNVHTHLFSNILKCNECGTGFIAGLDRPRKDGYTPSKYRCNNRIRNLGCTAKMTSDDKIGNFVFNYLSNLYTATSTKKLNMLSLEKILLTGKSFEYVRHIDKKCLEELLIHIAYTSYDDLLFEQLSESGIENGNKTLEYEILRKEKEKLERAIDRLKKLFLFDDDAMSEKDFLIQRKELEEQIGEINEKLSVKHSESANTIINNGLFEKINNFMVIQELKSGNSINYKELVSKIDKCLLKDFIATIIKEIVVKDGKVISILFQNGLQHKFIYGLKVL